MADKEEERTRICDQCHKEVAVSNFALHESHCQRFLCLCPDCDEPVPRELLEQHHQNQHSQVKCTNCDKKVESCQLLDHECKARLQRCEFCPVELPLSAMAEHSLACGSRTERRSDCGRYITLRDQPEHGQICPDLNAPDNPSNGRRTAVVCRSCTRSFPLEEMAEHQLECDHTSEESKGDDDDGSHKQEQASPRLTSSMKSTLFSAQGKRQEGKLTRSAPVPTVTWLSP
ncbi:XIAP-associated factor 1-like isoform X2 [Oncorhynchus keta]|uniref:XIAP-associated factor 1-like isoform X2 n=1 Tax=Oncorhynchus keta TaxID=8018 RepID=UPI00227A0E96|nr:XIAP-associated factor 1-like isoform X2 [Oncorhynchus keta]